MAGDKVDPRAMTLAAGAAIATLTDGGLAARQRVDAPSEELAGKLLAHFRVERRLGKGGMGEVWLATDLALERPVAIKVLAPEIAADADARERFIREARAQARLTHPNICHIYFIGEQEGRLFFAMEYVEGESLQERLDKRGAIPVEEAAELCCMAAAGLAEAQRHGFTHRDVKPSNLLVDRHGVVKVADFGLVKDTSRAEVPETHVVGTPLYMAPEQARGDAADFRADIYALGVTLHQLVAGSPPFSGPTPMALVSMHQTEPRPRLAAAAGRAALADALCERMMAKRPADRPATYDEVIAALEDLSPRVTRPAGFWVRVLGLMLDLIVAASVGGVIAAVTGGPGDLGLATIFAILNVGGHARWGMTPGKSALETQVIAMGAGSRSRGLGWRRAGGRFVVEYGPSYLALGGSDLLKTLALRGVREAAFGALLVVVGVVVPLVLALAGMRKAGKRTLWDKAAGTRVVYRRSFARQASTSAQMSRSGLPPAS